MVDAPTANSEENAADAFLQGGISLRNAAGPYFGKYGGRWMPESLIAAWTRCRTRSRKPRPILISLPN